jgi:hypothetical protein
MHIDVEKKLQQIIEKNAAEAGLTVEEYRKSMEVRKPKFLEAAEEDAKRLGITAQELLDMELKNIRDHTKEDDSILLTAIGYDITPAMEAQIREEQDEDSLEERMNRYR